MLYFDQFKSQLLNFSNSECTPEMPIGSEKNPNLIDYKVNLNWVNIDYLTDLIGFNLKIYNKKFAFFILLIINLKSIYQCLKSSVFVRYLILKLCDT